MEKLPVRCAVIRPPSLPMYGGYQTAEWFLRRQGRAPSQDETAAKGPGPKLFSHFEWRLSLPFPSHRVEYRILEFRKTAHTRTQSADRNPRTHQKYTYYYPQNQGENVSYVQDCSYSEIILWKICREGGRDREEKEGDVRNLIAPDG